MPRRRSLPALFAAPVVWLLLSLATAVAQPAGPVTRAGTFISPPLVLEQDGKFNGFCVELWQEIARRLGLATEWQVMPGVTDAFQALRDGKVDILVAGVLITAERDREFDFTYPFAEVGQAILVPDSGGDSPLLSPLLMLLGLLVSRTTLVWFAGALLFVVVAAHLVWLLERRRSDGLLPTRDYLPGILHAMHWTGATLLTQGGDGPRQPLARAFGLIWMFVGIVFVALYTAQLTADLTVARIHGEINGPKDLPGRVVGTLAGSVSEDYLRRQNAKVRTFDSFDALYAALLERKVEAVVLAALPLRYFASHEGQGRVRLVGEEFDRRSAAFAVPVDSGLRRRVDGALVSLQEDGTYGRLYRKWFGE